MLLEVRKFLIKYMFKFNHFLKRIKFNNLVSSLFKLMPKAQYLGWQLILEERIK